MLAQVVAGEELAIEHPEPREQGPCELPIHLTKRLGFCLTHFWGLGIWGVGSMVPVKANCPPWLLAAAGGNSAKEN